jgi:aspartate/tyrosine/aromatic aminotransferase
MLEDLANAPHGSLIYLQMSSHNPTGCDPKMEEWEEILKICAEKRLRPIFDTSFQGFASGKYDKDATASLR